VDDCELFRCPVAGEIAKLAEHFILVVPLFCEGKICEISGKNGRGNFGSVPPTVLLTPSQLPLRTVVHCEPACYGEFRDGALGPRILSAYFDRCEREEEHPNCGTRFPSLSIKFVAFLRSSLCRELVGTEKYILECIK
jgi:hypothetical protein